MWPICRRDGERHERKLARYGAESERSNMQTFDLTSLLAQHSKKDQAWLELLRVPSLSLGIYSLKAGQADQQRPHTEDEVYYVVSGKASFQAGDEKQVVGPGTLIFVERPVEHR